MAEDNSSIEGAAAAAHLSLRILENFFANQIGEGAVDVGSIRRLWKASGAEVASTQIDLAVEVQPLVDRMIDRLDREEADRFD